MRRSRISNMNMSKTYSHLNGLEYLLVKKPHLWDEIRSVIGQVDVEKCKTQESKERGMVGKLIFSPIKMNASFKTLLDEQSWEDCRDIFGSRNEEDAGPESDSFDAPEQKSEIQEVGQTPIFSYNQTDFVKDRVAIEIQFGKCECVQYDLFVKHLAFYVKDQIDVGIEILPMKSLQSQMSSGPSYYEGELYNLIREGRGVPAVPLILIGVAP